MKKILIALTLVLTLGVGSLIAYADSGNSVMGFTGRHHNNMSVEEMETWMTERDGFRKEELKNALDNGTMTESQAKEWEEHFEYMDEFHNKNGYLNSGRGCGRSSRTGGMGHGMGHGMMRGNRY